MKNKIYDFLKGTVIGRILETDETIYSLEEGKLEGVYSDQMIFSDLSATENGIQFQMTTITKEKVYELDHHGDRNRTVKDFTGTSVFRYELAMRKSTSEITGYVHCISSTVVDHTMEAVVYGVHNMKLENEQLRWNEQQLFYRDNPAGNGHYRPVAFDSSVRFYLQEGKLIFEYLPIFFDVNPETMVKTPSKDKYPPYITREK